MPDKWFRTVFLVTLSAVALVHPISAGDNDTLDRFITHGVVEIGIEHAEKGHVLWNRDNNVWASDWEKRIAAEADFEIRFSSMLSAEIDIEGAFSEPGLKLQKGIVVFDLPNRQFVRVGNMKRRLGLEEREGKDELITAERSLLHRHLASLHIMGYSLACEYQFRWGFPRTAPMKTWLQLGGDADLKVFGEAAGRVTGDWGRVGYSILYAKQFERHRADFWALAGNYRYRDRDRYAALELLLGKDPNATYIAQVIGERTAVYFVGTRAGLAFPFVIGGKLLDVIQPVLVLAHLSPDLRQTGWARFEANPGVNFILRGSKQVRWMTDFSIVAVVGSAVTERWHTQEFRLTSQIQLAW
ncbi:MAG: hypothetical protein GF331_22760 [Chitinivibrionales bacterium]|nr:hypothetical protein [Chitinivibrionales bacterium]